MNKQTKIKNVFLLGIVEPDPELQKHMKKVFLEEGYAIEIASSGTEAMKLFEDLSKTRHGGFDLVITEHILSDYSGLEVINFLRSKNPDIQTVLLTSYDVNNCLELAIQEQIGSIIAKTKPLKVDELLHATHALLTGDIFGLKQHLSEGTHLVEKRLRKSEEKELIIREISEKVLALSPDGKNTKDVVAFVLDEMISNAIYGAPRSSDGSYLYDKGNPVELKKDEEIIIKYGNDEQFFGFSVTDLHGTLNRLDVLHAIFKQTSGVGMHEDYGGGGLFLIRTFIDRFIINISFGKMTETIGLLYLPVPREIAEKRNKSLLIFQTDGGSNHGSD